MSEQLKQQTLYNVSEANTKNLIWVDVYVSGTEGSAGTYASRRMTKAQLITFLNSNLSVAWSTITSKPTTLSGYGLGGGTLNRLAKFTPDGNAIGDSQIIDDGSTIRIGTSDTDVKLSLTTSGAVKHGIFSTTNSTTGGFGVLGTSSGSTSSGNTGVGGQAFNSSGTNIGVRGYAYTDGASVQNIGLQGEAGVQGATGSNLLHVAVSAIANPTSGGRYGLQVIDGSQGVGKFLKCMTAEGYANWGSLAISDVTSLQTTLDTKSPLNPRLQTIASSATVTPTSANDIVTITAQAVGLTLANPTGTFVEGQSLMIRIKDNGIAQTIAFGTNYRAIGITLPTTTVISKTLYLGIIYNSTDGKFDIIGLNQEA